MEGARETNARYAEAAQIANKALGETLKKCVPNASIREICEEGDARIKQLCQTRPKGIKRGIAFPTCVSVNEIIGHYSPLDDTWDPKELKEGDLVKVDLGVYVDGYPVIIGQSIVCGAPEEVTGRKADVILAAHTAAEAAKRAIKAGASNYQVTHALQLGYTAFGCNGIHGVLHHEIGHNLVDGKNIIHNKDLPEERVEDFEIQPCQAFLIEATASTGPGKARETSYPTVIYKRDIDNTSELRTQQARQFFAELQKSRPVFQFHSREETDKARRSLGIAECLRHYMIQAFPCVTEVQGEYVAKFTFTAVVGAEGVQIFGGPDYSTSAYKSDKEIDSPELQDLLAKHYGATTAAPSGAAPEKELESATKTTDTA
eukprot:Protomagalhaensia_wolfi_Nauph_80__1465@NODE_1887_length_1290_cov_197_412470_g1475_i0_p1_GENE_NODE_1887_length_1290_cov_197_412470_g1475_i0NODE_1887_length_1290_cov_197_412470_g1475_i0_p1_ORF_typecomplete_len373_score80_28Peptidase_M24/PF00557_24/9_4e34P_C10/PF14974_6/3_1e02P_C10/PF14974_6/0_48Peptidase_M66/PF10462_9/0_44FumaraseC_C/PF10415_9/35FumaraseC_C/PF10415_9/32_NODE_1887_length_1290_cov_197_412470_g1475_i0771195